MPRGTELLLRGAALLAAPLIALLASCRAPERPPEPRPGHPSESLLLLDLLESRRDPADASLLKEALAHPDPLVRGRAARAAARAPGDRSALTPAVLSLARAELEASARSAALFALGQLADPSTSGPLEALALDPSAEIRAAAVRSLGRLPGTPASLIAAHLLDPAPAPRGNAALALAALGRLPAGLGAELAGLLGREDDEGARWRILYLAAARPELLSDPALRGKVLDALAGPNFLAAAFAARALGEAPGEDAGERRGAAEALERLRGDERAFWLCRSAAAWALGRVAPEARPATAAPSGDAPRPSRTSGAPAGLVAFDGPPGAPPDPPFRSMSIVGPTRDPRAWIAVKGRGRFRIRIFLGEAPRAASAFLELARSGRFRGAAAATAPAPAEGPLPAPALPPPPILPEPSAAPFLRGAVGLGASPAGGARVFIALLPVPALDGRATLLGQVLDGMEVADRLEDGDVIEEVTLEGWPPASPPLGAAPR